MNKIVFIVCIVMCFIGSLSAQFSQKLDDNYGFRSFIFKKHPNDISNILPVTNPTVVQKNVDAYKCTDKDLRFNGINIQDLYLYFYKNQLYQIRVEFGTINQEYTAAEYTVVQDALIRNYGTPYISNEVSPVAKILNSSFWMGNKVLLNHMRMNFEEKKYGEKYNNIAGYLLFTETTLQALQQADELK